MIEAQSITMSFPGVRALDAVDFQCLAGEVHAVVGENGAGKSTLMKVLAGAYKPDSGAIVYGGNTVSWSSPHEARAAGINIIYQEFNLFPDLRVGENIFLAQEPTRLRVIDQRKINEQSVELLDRLGIKIDPKILVGQLSVADQQMVEVAKALVNKMKVLILDEPTAVLSGPEVDLLFDRIKKLKAEGAAIIYVSHRLQEVFRIADRVTVLKDGKLVKRHNICDVQPNALVSLMIGRELSEVFPPKGNGRGEELLRVENLNVGTWVRDASLSVHAGEVLGLAGLVGSGRTELAQGIYGGMPITSGQVTIGETTRTKPKPKSSINSDLGLLSEDRRRDGLMTNMHVRANITAPIISRFTKRGFLSSKAEKMASREEIKRYNIATRSSETNVAFLSGGNQQKVLIARGVSAAKKVLLLDEPTRGVDVGAKVEIYRIIRNLADQGMGILMISSELPEIIGMCDRVLVMRQGEITGELVGGQVTEEAVMALATIGIEQREECSLPVAVGGETA
jgi:ribose transport system ATP-binding protein